MRTITVPMLVLLVLITLNACKEEPDQPPAACNLEGSWELVSLKYTTPDTTGEADHTEIPTLKILNATHWMFVRHSTIGEEFVIGGGGPYTLEGTTYTEVVEYCTDPDNVGNIYTFECRVEGDTTWYHVGGIEGVALYDEVWHRVQ